MFQMAPYHSFTFLAGTLLSGYNTLSLSERRTQEGVWQEVTSSKVELNCPAPINVGSSVWIAESDEDVSGMIEYHPDSDTTSPVNPFPEQFAKKNQFLKTKEIIRLMSFKYKEDFIVAVNADLDDNAEIAVVFHTKTEK